MIKGAKTRICEKDLTDKDYKFHCAMALLVCLILVCSPASWAQPEVTSPANKLFIEHATILNFTDSDADVLIDQSVLIEDGVISRIDSSETFAPPANAEHIDASGMYLLPGLIDMHVHIWDAPELLAYLSYGITTVRNASGIPYLLNFKEQIESGTLEGPTLTTTGPILNGNGPNFQINHKLIETAQQAREEVQAEYEQGFSEVKVYSNLNREAYEAIRDEAKKLGMTIMGHTPEGFRDEGIPFDKPFRIQFDELLDDGFKTFEHIESIVWHALSDDMNEERVRELARKIAASGTSVDATLVAHHNLIMVASTQGEFLSREGVDMLNPFVSLMEQESYDFWANQGVDTRAGYDAFYGRVLKIFIEEGVRVVTGTDSGIFINIPGQSLIDELGLFISAGVSPYESLQAATVNGAQVLGMENTLGQVRESFIADLVLVASDPRDDVTVLASPAGVIKRGRWYDRSGIQALRQRAAQTSLERSQACVYRALAMQQILPLEQPWPECEYLE